MTESIDQARRIPAAVNADTRIIVDVTPERAGWQRCGLRVVHLEPGEHVDLDLEYAECAILPLAGACHVDTAGRTFGLHGRTSVFTHVSDWAYVGRDHDGRITSADGCDIAIAYARCDRHIDPYRIDAGMVPVEVRGSGHSTRQLNNFLAPGIADADRLVAVEVLTPRGNWSSWPSHKHDAELRDSRGELIEADLEEIYYYRISSADGSHATRTAAFGMHRTWDSAAGWDMSTMVQTDDVVLVPSGYHGPCIAAPEYDMYYLNVLAGEQPERSLAFNDDPDLAWIREQWRLQIPDPRVPFTSEHGPIGPGTRSAFSSQHHARSSS